MIEYYTVPEVLRILNLPAQSLHTCLKAALYPTGSRTRPRRFSFHDLIVLRTVKGLCEAGIPVHQIHRAVKSLKEQLSANEHGANVTVYADGNRVVITDGTQRWQPDSGQVLLDFDVEDLTVRHVERLPDKKRRVNIDSAQAWFERGLALEEVSTEQAMEAYQKALELDPSAGDAHVNLGVLHYQRGEFDQAVAHYREASHCPASAILAYFNLAVSHEDTNDPRAAIEAYQQVLELEPSFADAHHNLARLYEVEGRHTDAIRHYSAAHKLTKPCAKIP